MADTTANRGYPYPQIGDDYVPHTDIQALADAVDADVEAVDNARSTRIATNKITSDSSTVGSTETERATVAGTLVSGQKYMITFIGRISSDVAADSDNVRIHEDNAAGTQIGFGQVYCPTNSANGYDLVVRAEYTAVSSASKTFSLTIQRSQGSGTAHRIRAGATTPCWFLIDKVV